MAFAGVSGTIGGAGPLALLHGGAWAIPDTALADHQEGLAEALAAAQFALSDARPAIDAVTRIVAALEGHGAFDAGCGAMLNRAGDVELDAGLMDGPTGRYGGVMAVQRLAHPIRVAYDLLQHGNGQAALLAGDGAEAFAEREGHTLVANETLICERERQRYAEHRAEADVDSSDSFLPDNAPSDTVGALVRDAEGRLAAATSTGGMTGRRSGRVGDSPIIGAGTFADNGTCAVSATGDGEVFMRWLAGHEIHARMRHAGQSLADAAEHVVQVDLAPNGGSGGLVAIDRDGNVVMPFSCEGMYRGVQCEGDPPRTAIYR